MYVVKSGSLVCFITTLGKKTAQRVTTIAHYIDLMDEQLLQKLQNPKTRASERTAIVDELRTRLDDIGR